MRTCKLIILLLVALQGFNLLGQESKYSKEDKDKYEYFLNKLSEREMTIKDIEETKGMWKDIFSYKLTNSDDDSLVSLSLAFIQFSPVWNREMQSSFLMLLSEKIKEGRNPYYLKKLSQIDYITIMDNKFSFYDKVYVPAYFELINTIENKNRALQDDKIRNYCQFREEVDKKVSRNMLFWEELKFYSSQNKIAVVKLDDKKHPQTIIRDSIDGGNMIICDKANMLLQEIYAQGGNMNSERYFEPHTGFIVFADEIPKYAIYRVADGVATFEIMRIYAYYDENKTLQIKYGNFSTIAKTNGINDILNEIMKILEAKPLAPLPPPKDGK